MKTLKDIYGDNEPPAAMVQVMRLTTTATLPTYAIYGAAGMDLYASESAELSPGKHEAIRTGIAFAIPEGYEGQIRPRSGLAYHRGVTVLNAPGTIDSDFRGEVRVILINHSKVAVAIAQGMRIAQIVFAPVIRATLVEVESLDETKRGAGGFGSTGK